ncbi:MAG: 3-isopropylmalate dehydratase [Nitrospinota bacterium]
MKIAGRAHVFGDDVNTDYIIAARHRDKALNPKEFAKHAMEDLDPGFSQRVRPGDFVVAGRNFGSGSSREWAPRVLKELQVGGVIARGFARIFFRNAINAGLPAVEADTSGIRPGDELELDLEAGKLLNKSQGRELSVAPLPPVMIRILADGGLVEHFKKHGDFQVF